jgi:hypothetical protein
MRSDGVTMKGVLVIVAVCGVAAAILFTLSRYVVEDSTESADAFRMRTIYTALFLYESSDNGLPPPNLDLIRRDLGDDQLLHSANDPIATQPASQGKSLPESFPIDPAFPDTKAKSPVRISFTYLPIWAKAGKAKVKDWHSEVLDVRKGILACYWYGRIDKSNPDGRLCDGPVLRVNMDGSVYRLAHRSNSEELTADDMFFRR